MSINEIMPSDGVYKGVVDVSIQSKDSNSSITVSLKNPEVRKFCAGFYLTRGDDKVCLSNIDIETIEQLDPNVFIIKYSNSKLVAGIVFWAA